MADKTQHERIRCSFCGKSRGQVQKMVSGANNTYICDECIETCYEILKEDMDKGGFSRPSFRDEIKLQKPKEIKKVIGYSVQVVRFFRRFAMLV